MTNNSLYYIWLSEAICGSYSMYRELTETIGGVYDVYSADPDTFFRMSSRIRRAAESLSDKSLERAISISDFCMGRGIEIITYEDPSYPSLLRDIEDPPLVLYVRGRMPDFERRLHIAVVGTRSMTEYGKSVAYNMGYSLAKNGAVVVSGMALGCDSVAMCGALDARGSTVAVLGCGVDIAYPPQHARLMSEILDSGGAIISEYSPGTVAQREFFVRRNRLISGISRATLVVEADIKSGAMHTARFADAQGRMLYAIPGKVGEKTREGTLSLISEGARVALEPLDILKEYAFLYRGMVDLRTYPKYEDAYINDRLLCRGVGSRATRSYDTKENSAKIQDSAPKTKKIGVRDVISGIIKKNQPQVRTDPQKENKLSLLPPDVREVYDLIPKNEIFFADDVERYGVSVKRFMSAVTILEISGLASSYPGSRYTLE